ncbi:MAG TPA: SRPBCC domain-containing protein [Solirubrobacteraceae bacterium]
MDPPRRLAFTWFWDGSDTRQLIEIDFEEIGGVTTVRFTHRDLRDEEAVRSHEEGGGKCFDNLARVLAEDLAAG